MTVLLQVKNIRWSYAKRLRASLVAYLVTGALLTCSTLGTFHVSAVSYYLFLQVTVLVTAAANGLSQQSAFAFVAGFGRSEYAPAILTGEAMAALAPSIIGK